MEGLFALHGQKIVMIARFMPGVRAVTYFSAGSAGMSYWRFLFWDGLAALLSAPFFVWLGFHFGDKLDYAIDRMKEGQLVVFGALAVVGLGRVPVAQAAGGAAWGGAERGGEGLAGAHAPADGCGRRGPAGRGPGVRDGGEALRYGSPADPRLKPLNNARFPL